MKYTRLCFILLAYISCNGGLNSQFIEIQYATYDSLTQFSIPEFISERIHNNWVELYHDYIIENNPELLDLKYEDVRFLIIPALNIPIDSLSAYDGNIFNYFRYGEFSLNNAEIWVFEEDTLRASFHLIVRNGNEHIMIGSADFSPNLKYTHLSLLDDVNIYFKVVIYSGKNHSGYFLPGIFFKHKNKFKVYVHGKALYSLEDFYKIRWNSPKGLEYDIQWVLEADSIMNSMLEYG
ncbi:hypothetical protein [Roseimarinus sediminis]|uniref:hypothetical protein n=1 Tax=Roseimarinus sediminis TaxID=1610899 RepID=UPI003D23D90D